MDLLTCRIGNSRQMQSEPQATHNMLVHFLKLCGTLSPDVFAYRANIRFADNNSGCGTNPKIFAFTRPHQNS